MKAISGKIFAAIIVVIVIASNAATF